jgi:hypothetical protein
LAEQQLSVSRAYRETFGRSAIFYSWDPRVRAKRAGGSLGRPISRRAAIKFDCAEFQHSHEIAKLVRLAIWRDLMTGNLAPARQGFTPKFMNPIDNFRVVLKTDCTEFQHSREIAKIIGSPPGYLGHRETHPLLRQEVLKQNQSRSAKSKRAAIHYGTRQSAFR